MRTLRWGLGLVVLGALSLLAVWLLRGAARPKDTFHATRPADSARPPPAPPTLRPSAGLRIQGTVVDEALGAAVAGARVSATWPVPGHTLSERPCPEGTLPPDSPHTHPDKRDPQRSECMKLTGRLAQGIIATLPLEQTNDLFMERVAAREGEVPIYAETTTAADGTFVLEGLPEGPLALWVLSEHGALLRPGIPAGSEGVKLVMGRGQVVEGIVRGEGAPVAGATVTVLTARHARYFGATSDADGHFRIGPLPPGPLVTFVASKGWLPMLAPAETIPWSGLSRAHPLTGRVLSDGEPVPGAEVRVGSGDDLPEAGARMATTDAEGRFTFMLPSGSGYTLTASRDGRYALARVQLTGTSAPPEVILESGSALHVEGRVSDDAGRPVPGARVALIPGRGVRPVAETTTHADGRYRLGPVEPGTWRFEVKAERHLDPVGPLEHTLTPGTAAVDFTLPRASAVTGRITDPKGLPLRGLELSLVRPTPKGDTLQEQTRTDADGRFLLHATDPGDHRIDVRESRQRSTSFPVRAPAEDVRLSLTPGPSVKGTVVDVDGLPLEDCRVELHDPSTGAYQELLRAEYTDARGRFHLRGVKPGHYVVRASLRSQGFIRDTWREVDLRDGEALEVELRMRPERSLSGIVVDRADKPVPGASIEVRIPLEGIPPWRREAFLRTSPGGDSTRIITGPEGRFTVWHLTEPGYYVRATKDGASFIAGGEKGDRRVAAGEQLRVDANTGQLRLVMERFPHATGRLVGPDGKPLIRFQVNDEDVAEATGAFAVPLYSENRTLLFRAPGMERLVRDVEPRGTGLDLDLGVLQMTALPKVRGRVVDAETSVPVRGARIELDSPFAGIGLLGNVSAADGSFELGAVDSKPFTLVVSARGRYRQQLVDVDAIPEALTVRMDPGARVEVTVRDRRGPLREARVRFEADSCTSLNATAREGRLVQRGLEPGPYTVVVQPVGDAGDSLPRFTPQRVELPASGELLLPFEEAEGGVTVKLRSSEGSIHDLVLVQGSVPRPRRLADVFRIARRGWTRDIAAKEATFLHVPQGQATVVLLDPGSPGRVHVEELDIPAEGTVSRELQPVWRTLDSK
ncbi:carboxypeptidase regulatory-like domain-containing protein [Pyxidicoccus trucidator]|uniref:carboxypeptidase regulatory-like domain-containing protein n=1 Tax=Pyxidicoccus trucidator TaxID=2709662 RepID=UPI0013D9EECB|nr:carboxypeptidase regulatory-like domain-containing protein [Pyxidicoccus trucidator]